MSLDTAARVGSRVAEHARAHGVDSVRFVLHGGEPLLCSAGHLGAIITSLKTALDGVAEADIRVHTNGIRLGLDQKYLDLFAQENVLVGISLDGDRAANDLHRRYADGRTSHPQVLRALALLRRPEYRQLYAGILCTIDLDNDPVETYEALAAEEPPKVGLLLPHGTWDAPPAGLGVRAAAGPPAAGPDARPTAVTPYADWLTAFWRRWTDDGRPMGVRIFDSIASTLRGGPSLSEALSLAPSDVLVVETDGGIEMVDTLKVTYPGAAVTGLNVLTDTLDAALTQPGVRARQSGLDGLCRTCQECSVVSSCGGGLYPHRYGGGSDFDNPSVYCDDLKKLIGYLADHDGPAAAEQHVIDDALLAQLASGFGGPEAIAELAAAQASICRELLADVYKLLAPRYPSAHDAWRVLTRVDAVDTAALAEVLAHPYFRAWAVKTLDGAETDGAEEYLTAIALVAAVRAGVPARLRLTPLDGQVVLPTLGTLLTESATSGVTVVSTGTPGEFSVGSASVRLGHEDQKRWIPALTVSSGDFVVRLEDADGERDCHQWPVSGPLPEGEQRRWQDSFDAAWQLIVRDHAAYAPGLRAGLSTLTPLAPHPGGHELSATARQAPGAVAAALPATPELLALLMIHEFQHVKLGAVLDCFDLYDESESRLFYAPWREDPRPFEGLLQGTYAHIAVADFWRVRRGRLTGSDRDAAEAHFARWRTQTAEAIEVLAGSGALTPLGVAFVGRMRATVGPWLAEPVGVQATAAAEAASAKHRAAHAPLAADLAANRANGTSGGGPAQACAPATAAATPSDL